MHETSSWLRQGQPTTVSSPEFKILADVKILAFQNPEFNILADFKILNDFKILAFQNPQFKILEDSRF